MIRLLVAGAASAAILLAGTSARADTLVGTARPDVLVAGTGPSTVRAGDGADVLFGDGDEVHVVGSPVLLSATAAGAAGDGAVDAGGDGAAWSMSADGRRVGFSSVAGDLDPGDGNGLFDVFVKTLADGAIDRASETAAGADANGASRYPALSPDGRRVAFASVATNLVAGDPSGTSHIYLKDLSTRAVTRLSQRGAAAGNGDSTEPVFSPDGSRVAFRSVATNLTERAAAGIAQIYVRTIATGAVELVSADAGGAPGNGDSFQPVFSPDGTRVAFASRATNLVAGDTNGSADVFVRTLASASIVRVSVDGAGNQQEGDSIEPAFSPDGRRIAFTAFTDSLAPGDANGVADVVVKTLASGRIALVSTEPDGDQSIVASRRPAFAPDGVRIAFTRETTLLAGFDRPLADLSAGGVYVKDTVTGALSAIETDAADPTVARSATEALFFPAGDRVGYLRVAAETCDNLADCSTQVLARRLAEPPGGNDLLAGGDGDDRLVGGPGDDELRGGTGDDLLLGGGGDDLLVTGTGVDTAQGGAGFDILDLGAYTRALDVNLRRGTARRGGDVVARMSGIEAAVGGRGNDHLTGDAGPNELHGGPGDDVLDGGSNSRTVIDTASYARAGGPIRLDFARGRVRGGKSVGTDTFARTAKGLRIHQVVGSRFDDILDGSGVDRARLEGGPGDDTIIGGGKEMAQRVVYRTARRAVYVNLATGVGRNLRAGSADVGRDRLIRIDMVSGSDFGDLLIGNDGANVFNGNGGADRLRGRGGDDEFVYLRPSDSPVAAPDVIEDFATGDHINLTALGVTRLVTGPIPRGGAKVVRFRRVPGGGVLDIDLDADAAPEMRIRLPGVRSITARQVRLTGEPKP
jgi:Tol biopolymer transport system component